MRIIHTSDQRPAASGQRSAVSDQWPVVGNQWSVVSGQWPVVGDQQKVLSTQYSVLSAPLPMRSHKQRSRSSRPSPLSPASCSLTTGHRPLATVRRGFTITELLVVVVIIGILAAMVLGALQMARQAAREAKTKATIAKLNNIIMQRYESYMTRRAPIDTTGLKPREAAVNRLFAIRDLMRMEMPDKLNDVINGPIKLPNTPTSGKNYIDRPALSSLYNSFYTTHYKSANVIADKVCAQAAMLYMIVSLGSPEAMEQFQQSEIGDTDNDGMPEFLDGWGRPIFFLRWAPGFSSSSNIQVADPVKHHDPFDPRGYDSDAYQLFPLIYSGGANSDPGLKIQEDYWFSKDEDTPKMFSASNASVRAAFLGMGIPKSGTLYDGITNHYIEQR